MVCIPEGDIFEGSHVVSNLALGVNDRVDSEQVEEGDPVLLVVDQDSLVVLIVVDSPHQIGNHLLVGCWALDAGHRTASHLMVVEATEEAPGLVGVHDAVGPIDLGDHARLGGVLQGGLEGDAVVLLGLGVHTREEILELAVHDEGVLRVSVLLTPRHVVRVVELGEIPLLGLDRLVQPIVLGPRDNSSGGHHPASKVGHSVLLRVNNLVGNALVVVGLGGGLLVLPILESMTTCLRALRALVDRARRTGVDLNGGHRILLLCPLVGRLCVRGYAVGSMLLLCHSLPLGKGSNLSPDIAEGSAVGHPRLTVIIFVVAAVLLSLPGPGVLGARGASAGLRAGHHHLGGRSIAGHEAGEHHLDVLESVHGSFLLRPEIAGCLAPGLAVPDVPDRLWRNLVHLGH
mmetsp:Transcript_34891/g.54546  ORF Transcript_34891/g.54546 Transcript_34891/m.54546 type:complete len:402 (-) Transcript_34891:189-1394(-)